MKQIHLCVPVLKRYDLLRELLLSLQRSTIAPVAIHIIDNGKNAVRLHWVIDGSVNTNHTKLDIFTPKVSMGVAESWNWFLQNVPEERVISNDDIIFAPESLATLTAPDTDIVWATDCGFSCFVIRDSCVQKVGLFDETISPGYGYYEDMDYLQRIDGLGTRPSTISAVNADAGVFHTHSATLLVSSHEEILDHHRKFLLARANYARKWHLDEVTLRNLPDFGGKCLREGAYAESN